MKSRTDTIRAFPNFLHAEQVLVFAHDEVRLCRGSAFENAVIVRISLFAPFNSGFGNQPVDIGFFDTKRPRPLRAVVQ